MQWGSCRVQLLFIGLLCLLITPLGLTAEPRNIEGNWQFQAGDDLAWAAPNYDDSAWQSRPVPGTWPDSGYPDTNQFGWYRTSISVNGLKPSDIGIRIGAIRNAYEIYIGGTLQGGVGSLPPNPIVNYDRLAAYRVPESAIPDSEMIVIALRVWGGSQLSVDSARAGPYAGRYEIGSYTQLIRDLDADELPKTIFASLFFLTGWYFLYLYFKTQVKTRTIASFLWFGLTALMLAVYIVTQSQWKYSFELPFVVNEKIESVSLFLFLPLCIQLIWTAISQPLPIVMRGYQVFFVLFAFIFGLTPGLEIHYQLRIYWQIVALTLLVPVYWVLLIEFWRNNHEARVLFSGLFVFSLCAVNDLLINMDLNAVNSIRLMPLGFLAMLISMGVSLAGRFNGMLTSLEYQVTERTSELRRVNEQLEAANRSLVEMTRIDPLTGLLNRRGLIAEAEVERQRFLRHKEPLALVIADVDHFKKFNDEHGHACGDLVLTSIADLFRELIRDIDRVSRWGGEEFVLLFPGTDETGLRNICDKLRHKVSALEIDYEGRKLSVTMTFGAAVYRLDESLDECLDRADAALYRGKTNGRNRVEMDR